MKTQRIKRKNIPETVIKFRRRQRIGKRKIWKSKTRKLYKRNDDCN